MASKWMKVALEHAKYEEIQITRTSTAMLDVEQNKRSLASLQLFLQLLNTFPAQLELLKSQALWKHRDQQNAVSVICWKWDYDYCECWEGATRIAGIYYGLGLCPEAFIPSGKTRTLLSMTKGYRWRDKRTHLQSTPQTSHPPAQNAWWIFLYSWPHIGPESY